MQLDYKIIDCKFSLNVRVLFFFIVYFKKIGSLFVSQQNLGISGHSQKESV